MIFLIVGYILYYSQRVQRHLRDVVNAGETIHLRVIFYRNMNRKYTLMQNSVFPEKLMNIQSVKKTQDSRIKNIAIFELLTLYCLNKISETQRYGNFYHKRLR